QAAELAHHLLLLQVLGRGDRAVHRRDEQVLQHLRVVGVDGLRLDLDVDDLERAGRLHRHGAPPGAVLDERRLQLLLRLGHLLLHLAQLGHHLLRVDLGHLRSSISRASNFSLSSVSSSFSSIGSGSCSAAGASGSAAAGATSSRTLTGLPTAWPSTSSSSSRLGVVSAVVSANCFERGKASTTSPSPSARGLAYCISDWRGIDRRPISGTIASLQLAVSCSRSGVLTAAVRGEGGGGSAGGGDAAAAVGPGVGWGGGGGAGALPPVRVSSADMRWSSASSERSA